VPAPESAVLETVSVPARAFRPPSSSAPSVSHDLQPRPCVRRSPGDASAGACLTRVWETVTEKSWLGLVLINDHSTNDLGSSSQKTSHPPRFTRKTACGPCVNRHPSLSLAIIFPAHRPIFASPWLERSEGDYTVQIVRHLPGAPACSRLWMSKNQAGKNREPPPGPRPTPWSAGAERKRRSRLGRSGATGYALAACRQLLCYRLRVYPTSEHNCTKNKNSGWTLIDVDTIEMELDRHRKYYDHRDNIPLESNLTKKMVLHFFAMKGQYCLRFGTWEQGDNKKRPNLSSGVSVEIGKRRLWKVVESYLDQQDITG